jgi:GNAT superfamily N-acetyltransferase
VSTTDVPGAGAAPAPTPAPDAAPPGGGDTLEVVRTYLELALADGAAGAATRSVPDASLPDASLRVVRRAPCSAAEYRQLYQAVGGAHRWRDRLAWSDAQLDAWLARPDVNVWVLEADALPQRHGGYYELQRHADGTVEVLYFGLVRALHGRGVGRALLEHAIAESRRLGAPRVVLNTCTLDGPAALPNYLARGFRPVREERYAVPADG